MAAWYDAFACGEPVVATIRRDGALAAVAALEARGAVLHSATNWHTPEYDIVADSEDAAELLVDAILARHPRRLELRFVPDTSLALGALRAAVGRTGRRLLTRTLEESPYIAVTGSWESYLASINRKMRKELARERRRLEEEHGPVSVSIESGGPRLGEALETGFQLEASGWKGTRGTAIASRPETRAFYTAVAHWAAERGWLRLSFLSVGDRSIAFQFDLEVDGVVYQLKAGYDEAYRRFAPGNLLTQDVIRRAFETSAKSVEFLGAAERDKLRWTRSLRHRALAQAFAATPTGLAEFGAFRYGRPVGRRTLMAYRSLREAVRR
jgi:CelD/BcsL family acetyltransferase involved in cellulose biosynthesis